MRKPTNAQQRIIDFLKDHGETGKKDLFENCGNNYHHNGMFHFGNILSSMVLNGMIERVKKGRYDIPKNESLKIGLFKNSE